MSLLFEFARPEPFFVRRQPRVRRIRRQTRDLFDQFFSDDFFFPSQRDSVFSDGFMRDEFNPLAFDTPLYLSHRPQNQPAQRQPVEHKQTERKTKELTPVTQAQPQQVVTSWGNTDFSLQASDDGKYYYVEYAIPDNVDPSNLKASLRGNTLTLSGKQRNEWGDDYSSGWSESSFSRSLPVPHDIAGSLQSKTIKGDGHKLLVRIPRQPQVEQHADQKTEKKTFVDEKHNTSTSMDVEGTADVDLEHEEDIDYVEQEEKDTVHAKGATHSEPTDSAMQVENDVDVIPIEDYEIVTIDDDSDQEA